MFKVIKDSSRFFVVEYFENNTYKRYSISGYSSRYLAIKDLTNGYIVFGQSELI